MASRLTTCTPPRGKAHCRDAVALRAGLATLMPLAEPPGLPARCLLAKPAPNAIPFIPISAYAGPCTALCTGACRKRRRPRIARAVGPSTSCRTKGPVTGVFPFMGPDPEPQCPCPPLVFRGPRQPCSLRDAAEFFSETRNLFASSIRVKFVSVGILYVFCRRKGSKTRNGVGITRENQVGMIPAWHSAPAAHAERLDCIA
jgi:hypothetical protein